MLKCSSCAGHASEKLNFRVTSCSSGSRNAHTLPECTGLLVDVGLRTRTAGRCINHLDRRKLLHPFFCTVLYFRFSCLSPGPALQDQYRLLLAFYKCLLNKLTSLLRLHMDLYTCTDFREAIPKQTKTIPIRF